ncbi:hypothetical protein BCB4_0098 [Bacillus phage B4]|uniref:Uncharacterized protein n=2 Tax=Bequatrovirus B4 TaxID=1918005 RepID=J9PRS8_9CAUD|nr:hypothetical protein BCB4_0098 [Bacillus phage B4]YP_009783692.1 hypothetical protein QLX26_gp096 [Bacillus phage B5S]AEW47330.1 hypothetical protein B5S_0096 [Bacillus phage B5S]AEZ65891.1 hypothetical protein BCB4_0098 [Bacillus phage B4]
MMRSRGKMITQMNEFSKYLYWFSAYERMLRGDGRVTIHCKTDMEFQIVEALTKDKDTYTLRVGNSFSIFMKGSDK